MQKGTFELNVNTVVCIDLEKQNMAIGIRHADHATPSIRKSWH
jgi:hypothetical protein